MFEIPEYIGLAVAGLAALAASIIYILRDGPQWESVRLYYDKYGGIRQVVFPDPIDSYQKNANL